MIFYFKIFFKLIKLIFQKDIILVYQMGKVGSSSIYSVLKKNNFNVYHVHRINIKNIRDTRDEYNVLDVKYNDESTGIALNLFLKFFKHRKITIISGVRDPLERNISSYFQNISRYGGDYRSTCNFIDLYDHEIPIKWFDKELFNVTNTKFEDYKLNSIGIQYYDQRFTILVYKIESGMNNIFRFIEEELGYKINTSIAEPNVNIGSKKDYSELYLEFKKNKQKIGLITKDRYNEIYEHRYIKVFYN